MINRGVLAIALALGCGGAVLLSTSSRAHACGGFFCNQPAPNQGPPIAQAGENVVFVLDRDPVSGAGVVEAHIQIVYSGAVDQFSWVVPVTSLPTLAVGHDILFQILEPRTRPTFNLTWAMEGTCRGAGGQGIACGAGSSKSVAGTSSGDRGGGAGGPVVDVAFRGNVGPYESAIVRSTDPAALEAWLVANQYFVSPEASRIIQDYVATGSYFVALRLQMGRDVTEIQPIVLRLVAEEGCLPLKLTAVAATPDVRVNVWVLGAGRAVPINYTEVELNLFKVDWFTGGGNYDRILSEAANEAGGNAFAIEYAQPSTSAVTWFTVPPGAAAMLALARTPVDFWTVIQQLGLPLSGRVIQVLRTYIPEPASLVAQGITEAQFYAALPQYQNVGPATPGAFDAAAAAAAIDAEVLRPMSDLRAMFETHSTLTRVATFISPEEMTKDPLFVTNRTLPDVSNIHGATARVMCGDEDYGLCDAPIRVELDRNHFIFFRPPMGTCNAPFSPPPYDRADIDAVMPAATRGWRRDPSGPGDVILDNATGIVTSLQAHNAAVGGGAGCACAVVARKARHPLVGVLVLTAAAGLVLRRRRRRT